jgi:arrestin-related trafficking adapter 3/6
MNHTWPFFNATWQNAEQGSGADTVIPLKVPSATAREVSPGLSNQTARSRENLTPKEMKRLSLQEVQSRSFNKSDTNINQKGYRVFTPGDYIYNFELPIDSRLPETIDVELGNVKYELEAVVERAGAFRANLVGSKEVVMIRAPTEGSLETVEPIAISRDWEDQLHYDIVISGKSFPLGSQVPIAFKLTPLAKVRCHRIKVYITENIQYFTSNKRVHRLEPTRRIQLFEKRADAQSNSTYPGSSFRITAGGGVDYDAREAAARGDENAPRDQTNLLGNLEGQHNGIGPTEMEMNVQLPSCQYMAEKEKAARIHFDTTYANIQVHHWIKVSFFFLPFTKYLSCPISD